MISMKCTVRWPGLCTLGLMRNNYNMDSSYVFSSIIHVKLLHYKKKNESVQISHAKPINIYNHKKQTSNFLGCHSCLEHPSRTPSEKPACRSICGVAKSPVRRRSRTKRCFHACCCAVCSHKRLLYKEHFVRRVEHWRR